jgi:hypothetical protein
VGEHTIERLKQGRTADAYHRHVDFRIGRIAAVRGCPLDVVFGHRIGPCAGRVFDARDNNRGSRVCASMQTVSVHAAESVLFARRRQMRGNLAAPAAWGRPKSPRPTAWCRVSDSNRRPTAYKAVALPAELTRRRRPCGAGLRKGPAAGAPAQAAAAASYV